MEQEHKNRWISNWTVASLVALTLFILWNMLIAFTTAGLIHVLFMDGEGLGGIGILFYLILICIYIIAILPLWILLLLKLRKRSVIASGISIFLYPFLALLLLYLFFSLFPTSIYGITILDGIEIATYNVVFISVGYIFVHEFKSNQRLKNIIKV
jgi:hypothetical protein